MDMDFSQISELLGNMSEEELQNLQEAAQSLFSSFGGQEQSEDSCGEEPGGDPAGFASMFTPELLARLSRIMRNMHRQDPRADLILALKPHLSRRRQHRAEQAVQMVKMLELLPTLQEAMK